jgi:ABC-type polysaccharide/polyol phosphate export permease
VHVKLRHLLHQRHLLRDLLGRELQSRYVGSVGGFLWTLIQPLLLLLVYTFVFAVVLQVRFGEEGSVTGFALYLYCGMLPWHAVAGGMARSTSSLVQNRSLIRTARFPAKVLPTTVVLAELVTQAIGTAFLLMALLVLHRPPAWTLVLLPLVVALQVVFTLGLGYALSTLNVFFRDTAQLVQVALPLWMFLTPIFYPESRVPDRFRGVMDLNPLSHLVRMYRAAILEGHAPGARDLALFTGWALGVFVAGYWLFTRNRWKLADLV